MPGRENFDFKSEADKMLLAACFVADLELESIIETVGNAHSLGPILDPTAYRDALYSGHMDAVRDLAQALLEAQRIFREKIGPRAGLPA